MTLSAVQSRLLHETRLFIEHNEVSEVLFTGPSSAISDLEGAAQLLALDGTLMEWGRVTISSNLTTLTQNAPLVDIDAAGNPVYGTPVDWRTRFKVGDEIALAGSVKGNNGIKVIATVNAGTMTLTAPLAAEESGLYCAKTTDRLLRLCEEQRLFPGGYETDTQLRALLANLIETMQLRGSRSGITTEMNRVTNSSTTALLETVPDLTTLETGVAYTHSTKSLAAPSWYTSVAPGDAISIVGSTRASNGRYTVYGISGTSVQVGHRANRSTEYVYEYLADKTELLLREDRVNGQLWVALANQAASSKTVAFTVTVSGAAFGAGALTQGTGTVSTTSTVATVSLTAGAGSALTRTFAEARLPLTGLSGTSTFTLAVTSGSPTAVRLGDHGLCPFHTAGSGPESTPNLAAMYPWRWGGVVFTGLQSRANETGLTVYKSAKPSWFLGVTFPDSAEEESYSMASPDELVVVEVDHRNTAHYTKNDLATLVRSVMLPADVEGVLGLL